MQSLLVIKKPLPFEQNVFDKMKNTAQTILQNKEKKQYSQAIVILTKKNNEYSAFVENAVYSDKTDEKLLIDGLTESKDTEIYRILCLWSDGGVDLPSLYFRDKLLQLDSANSDAGIFAMTKDGPSVIKLGITIK